MNNIRLENISTRLDKVRSFYQEHSNHIAIGLAIISEIILYLNYLVPINFYNNYELIIIALLIFLTVFRRNIATMFLLVIIGLPFFAIHPLLAMFILLVLLIFSFTLEYNVGTYYILSIICFTFASYGSLYIVIPTVLFVCFFAKESKLYSILYPLLIALIYINVGFDEFFIIKLITL